MRTLEVGSKYALRLRERARLVVLGVGGRTKILGTYRTVVAHTLRVGAHIHVVPFNLAVVELKVNLGMHAGCKVMGGIKPVLERRYVHGLFAIRHLHAIVGALRPTEHVLHASRKHHSDAVFPEAVAYGQTAYEVGRGHGVALYLSRTVAEVACLSLVAGTESLVWSLVGVVATVGGEIVVPVLPEIIAHTHGSVGLYLEVRRRVLHHHVHHATCSVALHVGSKRLRHDEAVHKVGREEIERYVAVLVVGTRNLHTIYKRVVIALVHATEYGVGCLARSVALHRHTRHSLKHARHVDVGRELYALLTHHVEHVAGGLGHVDGAAVGMVFLVTFNHHLAKFFKVFVKCDCNNILV